jgi:glycosyltransferase involved in cell wall biosynthesis
MTQPVRVTLVTHYFPSHRGGVESVAWELASRLAANGKAQITWYASNTDEAPASRPGLHCVSVNACNIVERYLGLPFPLWGPFGLARLVRGVRASDVVHLHDYLYLPNLVAWAAACLARRPVVVTQHIGMIPYRNTLLRMTLAGANRLVGKLVLGKAAQAIFISEVVRAYFGKFVRFSNPPMRVSNGVDTDGFVPADEQRRRALRIELGAETGRPLILFVGRFVEKKGIELLQRMARRLPQARWIFVGWGALDPAEWGLSNVSVRRKLSRKELIPLYQAADLLVLPSVGEGFPLVVQEAMACGTPALVSDETAAGYPEAAADVLLQEPLGLGDEVARWSARVEALLASPETLSALRPRVAAFARSHWSWERCVEHYARVFAACAR